MFGLTEDYAEFCVEGKRQGAGAGALILAIIIAVIGLFVVLTINGFLVSKDIRMVGPILIGAYICVGIPMLFTLVKKKDVEYDYLYVENDLEISAIYNKEKRKKILTVHMNHAKLIAPQGCEALLGYEGRGKVKVRNFAAVNQENPYVVVVEKNNEIVEILIEPDEHMLGLMQAQNKDIFREK